MQHKYLLLYTTTIPKYTALHKYGSTQYYRNTVLNYATEVPSVLHYTSAICESTKLKNYSTAQHDRNIVPKEIQRFKIKLCLGFANYIL